MNFGLHGLGARSFTLAGPILAVIAVFLLPALRASAPLLPSAEWTVAELGTEVIHAASTQGQPGNPARPGLRQILHQGQQLRQEFGAASRRPSPRLKLALGMAAAIPAMAILAGLCGLLSLLLAAWGRSGWLMGVAAAGLGATVYAIGASWWLTQVARTGLAQFFTQAQSQFGGLLSAANWKLLQQGFVTPLGLTPEVGLYLLFLAFLIILIVPPASLSR